MQSFCQSSTIIYIQTVRLRKQTAKFRELTIDHNKVIDYCYFSVSDDTHSTDSSFKYRDTN